MAKQTVAVNSPTSGEVWAYLLETERLRRESDKRMEERDAKMDKELAESRKRMEERDAESRKRMEERDAKVDKEFAELRKRMEERDAESRKRMEERDAKVDKEFAELRERMEETRKIVDTVSKNLGGVGNTLGDIVEGMLTSDLFKKFFLMGYDFDESISNYDVCEKGTKRLLAEVDKLMFNGTIALAIEAKATLSVHDVNEHLKQMAVLQSAPNRLLNGKKLYGAMAGAKITRKAKNYALQKGFFVIEPSGDTVTIASPEGKPTAW
jgi:hypothetical protein